MFLFYLAMPATVWKLSEFSMHSSGRGSALGECHNPPAHCNFSVKIVLLALAVCLERPPWCERLCNLFTCLGRKQQKLIHIMIVLHEGEVFLSHYSIRKKSFTQAI